MENKNKRNRQAIIITYLVLILIGLLGIIFGNSTDFEKFNRNTLFDIINNVSITIFTIGLISMIYELNLRKRFMDSIKLEFESIIQNNMPERYSRLKQSGIVDGFQDLDFAKIRKRISEAEDCDIAFYKMWISNFDDIERALENAIEFRNCNVKILLLDPKANETLKTRALALGDERNPEMMAKQIETNISLINGINKRLEKKNVKGRIELKVHNSFIPCSMIIVGSEISLGLYLRNKLSTQGIHIRFAGKTRSHPQALLKHFKEEWIRAKDPFKENEEVET